MTTASIADYTAEGAGWRASFFYQHAYLSVDPQADLGTVVDELFLPLHQPSWTMEWSHVDEADWDVFLLRREPVLRSA